MKTMEASPLDTPLRAARKRRNLTLAQLGAKIGVQAPQVYRYELGGVKVKAAAAILQFFEGELTLDDLALSKQDMANIPLTKGDEAA